MQLIDNSEDVDYAATAAVCRRLFRYRRMHPWPPEVVKAEDWDGIYDNQRGDLHVAATCDEAVAFVNGLIKRIDKATRRRSATSDSR